VNCINLIDRTKNSTKNGCRAY